MDFDIAEWFVLRPILRGKFPLISGRGRIHPMTAVSYRRRVKFGDML